MPCSNSNGSKHLVQRVGNCFNGPLLSLNLNECSLVVQYANKKLSQLEQTNPQG